MKTESRVTGYKQGTQDWQNQFDMLLDDGVTCGDCYHSRKCRTIFGGDDANDYCQFLPNRFHPKQPA